ncbi:DUF4180 domain-containing protein [Streptomyces sp. NPDC015131]|uniref:DUF4180 domain-containing protein n=1 Tax=Streptomyces sp. NPDC015131 TaxID=3364941 RepID=UPI00370102C7
MPSGPPLSERGAVAGLLDEAVARGAELVVVPVERLGADFFAPRTGMLGEAVRRCRDLGLRLAVVGDAAHRAVEEAGLRDAAGEGAHGGPLLVAATIPALAARLAGAH